MSAALPPLYDRWIAALLGESPASEPRATCGECAMLPGAAGEYAPFAVETKCCTYHPDLYNFAVGRVLADGDSPAARLVEARIAAGAGVTPLGIAAPGPHRALYQEATRSPSPFGRVPALRCGFYSDGSCGIHAHRDAVCATWFCKYERGAMGKVYWSAIKNVLKLIERTLARHCLVVLELSSAALERVVLADPFAPHALDEHELGGRGDRARQRILWGNWLGRERELYARSAEIVGALTWSDVQALGGVELAAGTRALARLHRKMARLPRVALRGAAGLIQISPTPGRARLRSGSVATDHADVPAAPLGALPRLVGRPLDVALTELRGEGIDEALVRTLIDWQVLVAAQDNQGE